MILRERTPHHGLVVPPRTIQTRAVRKDAAQPRSLLDVGVRCACVVPFTVPSNRQTQYECDLGDCLCINEWLYVFRLDWFSFAQKAWIYALRKDISVRPCVVFITCSMMSLLQYSSPSSVACPGFHYPRLAATLRGMQIMPASARFQK